MNYDKTKLSSCLFAYFMLAFLALVFPASTVAAANKQDPFVVLRGKWRGTGTMQLKGSEKVRVTCNAQYTGSASQLILAIKCSSSSGKIDMRARLSLNFNRLRGVWEEKTFRALGTISGKMTKDTITFRIAGNLWGKMTVFYTKTRQKVSIEAKGVALQNVQINMKRR